VSPWRQFKRTALIVVCALAPALAQEASSGFDLRATVSAEALYSNNLPAYQKSGSNVAGGFRAVLYPVWKLSDHWVVSGAVEAYSLLYFPADLYSPGDGVRVRILQANLGYSRTWKNASLNIRAGQLTSAFGSFLLRYDDADNALTDPPLQYGYYLTGITTLGLAGAQADATIGKWDARAQFTNSSTANARSVFDNDQFGAWAGGGGYTIRQGLHVGLSGFRGPFLNSSNAFYFPGRPVRDLPSSGWGADAEWAVGHWNLYSEWQRIDLAYNVIRTYREDAGYVEARRVLNPRLYLAGRAGYVHTDYVGYGGNIFEAVAGYRLNTRQLIKAGYEIGHKSGSGNLTSTVVLQLVTTIHPLSMAFN